MIQVRDLRVDYDDFCAVRDISLDIGPGEIHGLLGPNGAGKTTLVKILSTVLTPTFGRGRVLGFDLVDETASVRPLIGIVFGGERGLYTRLTARQNLEYWGALYRLPAPLVRERTQTLLDRVGLADRANQRVEAYSRGMMQRLHLARGLIGDAQVLFLDEPTTGLDPRAAREFRRLISELKSEGRTIFLTTHDMTVADQLCDRVAFIVDGRIALIDSPRELKIRQGERKVRVEYRKNGGTETGEFPLDGLGDDDAFLRLLRREQIETIHTEEATLEDVFIKATGRSLV